ncbi:hypothetical protein GCM10010284_49340 [Streptomyces rubiginosohelvolus]|uniref:Uncharacterized protein n=1 Tax=Streptomyces rubiginosohelvolus TaxID=67362 RepID=A0ABQ3C6B7_9ACTN|nr:hypothetical protein GCM10010284_49340 [Streptomyces rubiginosohelvolus]GGZ66359.1 hypothetical protein GCM10010328_46680 [Streptomyces pluricolorescens]
MQGYFLRLELLHVPMMEQWLTLRPGVMRTNAAADAAPGARPNRSLAPRHLAAFPCPSSTISPITCAAIRAITGFVSR